MKVREEARQDGYGTGRRTEGLLDFERLEVYERAMVFVEMVFRSVRTWRRDAASSVGDQLRRAAVSIVANIAEGSGKPPGKAKIQFYGFALNSARETLALVTVARRLEEVNDEQHQSLRDLSLRICQMLGALQRSARERAREKHA